MNKSYKMAIVDEDSSPDKRMLGDNNMDEDINHPSQVIGGWGPMQMRIFTILTIIYIVAPLNNLPIVFTAPKVDFYCVDIDNSTGTPVHLLNSCQMGNDTKCNKFEYDRSFHRRTLINEFDLVCDRSWFPSMSQSLHQVGYAISGVVLGFISDRRGRFFCSKLAITLEILAGFCQAFAPNVYLYFLARLFVGIAAYGRFLNGYVLLAEWVGPKIRGRMAALYELGWVTGKMILPCVYYLVPDYVHVQLGVTMFEICVFIPYLLIVKESPRWQVTHDRFDEAEKVLKAAATEKGKFTCEQIDRKFQALKRNTMKEQAILKAESMESPTILHVWKTPNLLRVSLILYFSWFSLAFEGYASFYNIQNVGGSVYLNVFFMAWAEVGAMVILYLLVGRMERKILLISAVLIKSFLIVCVFGFSFHDFLIPLRVTFYILSTMIQSIAFQAIYIYTTESFPTTMRQTSLGTCSVFARMGSIMAPFIKELTLSTHLSVAIGLFCFLSVTNAILLMLLPDTTDMHLPDNIFQTKAAEGDVKLQRRRTSRAGSIPATTLEMRLSPQ